MFEHHSEPLISSRRFAVRVITTLWVALMIEFVAVGAGAIGFHNLERMDWTGACVNGAMVLTGNGMTRHLHTAGGQVFAIFDALLGALTFASVTGVVLAPIFHRILHAFHLDAAAKSN